LGRPSGADHEAQQPGLVGLDAAIMRSGYADEYDCCPPDQLRTPLDGQRIERQRRHASRPIPEGFDYGGVQHLRAEAHEQLAKIRPRTLGQAGRVSGNLGRERIVLSLTGEVFAVFAESASDIDSAPAR
jgi:tRNA U34 5-carboxymethylaminomethyl modifying enzyme MnmG/GidA